MQTEIESIVLSELQKKKAWEGWLASEMRGCYFAELVQYYQSRQRWLTMGWLASSSGAFFAILSLGVRKWPTLVVALVSAMLSFISLVQRNEEQARLCSDLHYEWNRLASDWESLWDNMYSDDAVDKLNKLANRSLELSKQDTTDIAAKTKLKRMEKWQEFVEQHHTTI